MRLVVGLGNPGKEHEKTRHNIGFMMIDKIKEIYNFPDFEFDKKFHAEISKNKLTGNSNLVLLKPQTFMNNSGQSVKSFMDFYKITPDNLIVIHDDIDIELGKYKTSFDSGSAGHNGVADIINKIDTQKFTRIRIGIANEKLRTQIDPSDFVLQKFSKDELDKISGVMAKIESLKIF